MKKLLIDKINSLPPLPSNIIELEKFRTLDDQTVESLIKIIEKDPLMVTTILRIANSSMFGFRGGVDTLSRAINLLGINFTISIAIGTVIQNHIDGNLISYAASNDDFLFTSTLATNLVNTWISSVDFDLKNELLLPAFLQDVGKFIISELIQDNQQTEEFLKELEDTKDISFCEEKFTTYTCSRITANIFKRWNFSHRIIFPIAFVDDIEDCPDDFKKHSQILQIVKTLCDIRYPLSDDSIRKAITLAKEYNFDIEALVNSIDVIKESLDKKS